MSEEDDRRGGRPRTGSLLWSKSGWRARMPLERDGETIRKVVPLGTKDKAVARRKLRRLLAQERQRFQAIALGHIDVQQHHVRLQRYGLSHARGAVFGLTHDLHVGFGVEQRLESGAQDGVVVG